MNMEIDVKLKYIKIMKKILIIIFAFCLLLFELSAQTDKNEVYKKLVSQYGKINTITVAFDSDNGQIRNGILKAKKGNKYNITIGQNKIISDGKTVWNYNPIRKNVVITDFIPEMSGLTLDYFFFNILGNLQPIALKTELSTARKKQQILELQAKDKNIDIRKVNLFMDENFSKITEIEIITNSFSQKWRIKNLEINKNIPDSNFIFKTPEGVEEIDMR